MTVTVSANSKLRDAGFSGPDLKLFIKDVSDKEGRKRPVMVKTWSTIKDVKDVVQKLMNVPQSAQRLYFGPLAGSDLPNHRTLHDAGIYRSGETLFLVIKGSGSTQSVSALKSKGVNDVCISPSFLDVAPRDIRKRLVQARRGFTLGRKPELVLDGSGGTYFLHDGRKVRVGVFKPADEEPYAENNPRGYVRQTTDTLDDALSMRAGIQPGEACLREVAAFLLDHGSFSSVPMTTMAEARHPAFNNNGSMLNLNQGGAAVGNHSLHMGPSSERKELEKKVGSFQEYVHAECTMDDISPSLLSVDEVHKIAILDIRILNADRNSANLLCRRYQDDPDTFELVPIDHGYCLKTVADVCSFDWCWLEWPQLKQPISEKSRKFILDLDIEADARMLEERLRIPSAALDYFRASTKLLQEGVRAGMNLYDIALLCCRNDDFGEMPSDLETLMSTSIDVSTSAVHNDRWDRADASRALAEQLSTDNVGSLSMALPPQKVSRSQMFKSASSINFTSFSSQSSSCSPPPPIQSSCSDSGSDDDEADEDTQGDGREREEWAASVIADTVNAFKKAPISPGTSRGRQRATSIQSCDSDDSSTSNDFPTRELSSSPVGFWQTSPNSTSTGEKELKEVSWSPHVSPVSHELEPDGFSFNHNVLFDDNIKYIPPRLGGREDVKLLPPPTIGTRMKRSQSYSGFQFERISDDTISREERRSTQAQKASSDQFHIELMKFIDLLVIRMIKQKCARHDADNMFISVSSFVRS